MRKTRSQYRWPAAAFVLLGTLWMVAGCGPRAGAGTAASAADIGLAVDLPALVIDLDAQGQPSLGGVPLAELGDAVDPALLELLAVSPAAVQFLTEHDIQHVHVSNTPTGARILVNGRRAPSLAWDADTLSATAELASAAMVDLPLLEPLLHLSSRLGVGITVRFPVAADNPSLPAVATAARPGDDIAAGDQQPSMTIPIYYESDGSWRVGDLTDTEWTSLTGLPWSALRMQTPVIEGAIAAGIEEIALTTDPQGIHVGVNGRELPYITWGNGEMENALALAGQLGLWEGVAAAGYDADTVRGLVASFLPIVQSTQATVVVHFPTRAAGNQ